MFKSDLREEQEWELTTATDKSLEKVKESAATGISQYKKVLIQCFVSNSFQLPMATFIEVVSLYKTLSRNCLFCRHVNYIPAMCHTINVACQLKYLLASWHLQIRDQL